MQILSAKQKIAAGLYAKQAIEAVLGDSNLIQKACEQNPWFTHYYIQKAGHALLQWMEEKAIVDFLNRYLTKKNSSKNVAVIMAANLPFVGFQDLFQVFLSGNICLYQFSSRDSVLMRAIVTEWKIRSTDIESFIVPFQKNSEVDFVVATGSDNTARYTDFKFRDVPRLIRKNRFSIAALSGEETKIDLEGLASDILL